MKMNPKNHSQLSRRYFLRGLGAVAAGLTFSPGKGWSSEEKRLNFYNWDTYIGETTLDDFRTATGIEVSMDLFADNDELFSKLKEGNPGYDVIVPSNDFVERMIRANMLVKLDHSKIPNFNNLDKAFQDAAFDPKRAYSMPYMWGTVGIGYRKSKVSKVPDSWASLFASSEYSGRIALLNSPSETIPIAMKYLGHSINTADSEVVQTVEDLMIKQKKHIKVFAEDNGQDLLLSGEVDLTMEYNGDIIQVQEEDDDIAYSVPKEGTLLWEDCLCIPKGAPHPENAHAFMNYLLDGDAGALIADFIQYATPNAVAKAKLGDEYRNNPAIFPTDEVLGRSESSKYRGEAMQRLFDEAWTRISAA